MKYNAITQFLKMFTFTFILSLITLILLSLSEYKVLTYVFFASNIIQFLIIVVLLCYKKYKYGHFTEVL